MVNENLPVVHILLGLEVVSVRVARGRVGDDIFCCREDTTVVAARTTLLVESEAARHLNLFWLSQGDT